MHIEGNKKIVFPIPHHEFIGFYKGDALKSFILWMFYSGFFGDSLTQSEIFSYCQQQFHNTLQGSSKTTIHNTLTDMEKERKYGFMPILDSHNEGIKKVYFIPNVVDLMLPWGMKLGLGGTALIVAIVAFLSVLLPSTWQETVIFGNNPPVIVHKWYIDPNGIIFLVSLSTLWLSIFVQYLHKYITKKNR